FKQWCSVSNTCIAMSSKNKTETPVTSIAHLSTRPVTPADTDEIMLLLETCLGKSDIPRTREFWEWKHYKNPFGISPAIVAVHENRIIGLRIFVRWQWNAAEQTFPAVRAVDTLTHPEWRGKGIFSYLTKQLVEQMKDSGVSF